MTTQKPPPEVPDAIRQEVEKLVQVVDPLVSLYKGLAKLLEAERKALDDRNPDLMETLASQIGRVLEEIQAADHLRQKMTRQLGARFGLTGDHLNLKSLDQAMGGNTALLALRERLKGAMDKADSLNRHNQAVFKGVLAATESILRVVKESTQGPVASYNRKGGRHASANRFHFISKQL
ncbi:MAG: flagellar protein FlgN [Magnetococcales bacterium]|nr:flagellar protein FlgN [Magnetococcales bacterium]MBF0437075.1 flagellar protein FlgN [Magnetococcales bacterium]